MGRNGPALLEEPSESNRPDLLAIQIYPAFPRLGIRWERERKVWREQISQVIPQNRGLPH
jgi:hypothetical protein